MLPLGWALVATMLATGPEDWAALHSGRLMHALERDPSAAISVYEAVIEHLDEGDPHRSEYLYWLGRAWFDSGDADQAAEVLARVDGRSIVGPAARTLRGRIELDRSRVPHLPAPLDLTATPTPVVPGWSAGTPAVPLTVVPPAGGGPATVMWPIATEDVRAGFLAVGLAPGAGTFEGVRFEARSSEVVLAARVVVETFDGRTYAGVPSVLRPQVWTDVDARVSQLRPQRPDDTALVADQVSMVAIELAPVDPGAVSNSASVSLRSIVLDGSP